MNMNLLKLKCTKVRTSVIATVTLLCMLNSSALFALEHFETDSPDHDRVTYLQNWPQQTVQPSLSANNNLIHSFAQNKSRAPQTSLRSKSEVVREVKNRYNAQVLKIKLNESASMYRVRILMPNGRVKEVTVSARR